MLKVVRLMVAQKPARRVIPVIAAGCFPVAAGSPGRPHYLVVSW